MDKPATNVGLRDGVERCFDRLDQRLDRPSLRAAQTRFALRPALLNQGEVRRIGRQAEEPRAPCRQQRFPPATLWADRLSHRTMSPVCRVGHHTSLTQQ